MLACTPARLRAPPLFFADAACAGTSAQMHLLLRQVCMCIEYVRRVLVLSSRRVLVSGEVARAWRLQGRRDPPSSLRDTCAASVGVWSPNAPAASRCNICRAMDAAKRRESVAGEYKNRCDSASVCRDIFTACPWMVELRRAPPSDLRAVLARVKKRLPPSNLSGLEDVLGRGGEAP